MSYKIVIDSCGELTEEMKKSGHFENVPLELIVDNYHIVDDETFDQADFLKKVKESKQCPKSSCPSPERYMTAYTSEAEHIYVVTLSAQLSGSYNSAELARNLYMEENGDKAIHVFDSKSASIGESLIGLKIQECEETGMTFEEIIRTVEEYIDSQQTYFVLETLDTLRKNGRLTGLKALVAATLNIKPIMGSTPEGSICQLGQARGMNRALDNMVREMVAYVKDRDPKNRVLAISHCNCKERALIIKNKIQATGTEFKDIILVDTAGVSSMYANDGGIVMVV